MTNLTIEKCDLSPKGIEIHYTYEGKTGHLLAAPYFAADLLYNCNYIKDFETTNDELLITQEITEEYVTPEGVQLKVVGSETITWDYFARHNEIDEIIAGELAIYHETVEKRILEEIFA